ncbi:hypothetical protein AAG570_009358, partial [Ranatra chinensis]
FVGILKGADLATTSAKKVRQEIEEKLDADLSSRKKEIDEIVMQCLKESGKKGAKKNGNKNDDDDDEDKDEDDADDKEEEDEEEEEEEEDDEDKKPKRGATPKKGAPAKRKKTSSDESEDASEDKESDEEYSPSKKSKSSKGKGKAAAASKSRKKKGSDSDSDEDWGKGKKAAAKKGGGKRGGGGGYNKTCKLTPELAAVVGSDAMARHEVVKKVWSIIKEQNLYDPKNKQYAICNDDLMKVIGVKRFRTFGMMKYLKKHFVD